MAATAKHLTREQIAHIASLWGNFVQEHGRVPEAKDWPSILPAALLKEAIDAGYFGAPGSIPGFDYGKSGFTGVRGETTDDGRLLYRLFVDGEQIAQEYGGGDFDTVAFAARHDVHI